MIVRASNAAWRRDQMSSSSYLSCDGHDLHVGIGEKTAVDSVRVRWPNGKAELFDQIPINRRSRIVEGSGAERSEND